MDCTVIGDVFFDVMVRRDLSKLDLVLGGTNYSPIKIEPGGIGNVAVGVCKLGGKTQLIGKAGKDVLGSFYRNDLIKEGVTAKILFDRFNPTGIIITFVNNKGERSFLVSRGANDYLLPEEVEQCKNDVARSKYLFICGYSLVSCPQRDAILKTAEIAKSNNVKVIFDPGAYNIVRQERQVFEKLIKLCDVITLNLKEAKALTNCDRIQDIGKHLSNRVHLIALRLGKDGCIIITPNKKFKCQGNKVNCVDSSGAGDAFASALIYGLTRHFPLETTAKLANWYASCKIQKLGPRSFPCKDEIRNYLSTLDS
jgi:sugar/nucleoside kinase (ribokinase family)